MKNDRIRTEAAKGLLMIVWLVGWLLMVGVCLAKREATHDNFWMGLGLFLGWAWPMWIVIWVGYWIGAYTGGTG